MSCIVVESHMSLYPHRTAHRRDYQAAHPHHKKSAVSWIALLLLLNKIMTDNANDSVEIEEEFEKTADIQPAKDELAAFTQNLNGKSSLNRKGLTSKPAPVMWSSSSKLKIDAMLNIVKRKQPFRREDWENCHILAWKTICP